MPPMGGPHGPGRRGVKPSIDNPGQVFKRLMKYIFKDYGAMFVIVSRYRHVLQRLLSCASLSLCRVPGKLLIRL